VSEAPQVADEVMKWMGENLLYFVHIQNVKQPLIYNAKFGNIDDKQDALAIAYNFAAEQFFFNE
jgi:peptide/nickel transport system substrate-binding protein